MTRKEAIETLKANYPDAYYEQLREAVDMAISALEQPESKWIPTLQKSHPDNAIRVQIQMGNGWIITGYYKDGYWYSVPECDTPLEDDWIVAWRDLGEPYREEGDA